MEILMIMKIMILKMRKWQKKEIYKLTKKNFKKKQLRNLKTKQVSKITNLIKINIMMSKNNCKMMFSIFNKLK